MKQPTRALSIHYRLVLLGGLAGLTLVLIMAFTADDPFFLAPFRESQTAISADYLNREPAGGPLAYQLPVLGAPWRIPFEFPFVQQLTALVARTGISVPDAGRLVNLAGFAACVIVLLALCNAASYSNAWKFVTIGFFVASPIYSVYATSHMIESWALFFALLQLYFVWRFLSTGWWRHIVFASAAGTAAALIKITTWLPAAALVGTMAVVEFSRARAQDDAVNHRRSVQGLLVVLCMGFAAGIGWSIWAGSIRSANDLARVSQEGGSLFLWMFGTLHDRLSLTNWILVGSKHLLLTFGPVGLLVPALLPLALLGKANGDARRRTLLLLLAAYLLHTVIFFRLHLRHDYYLVGSAVFLLAAVVFALSLINDSGAAAWRRLLASLLVISMIVGSVVYVTIKRSYRDLAINAAIQAVSQIEVPGALLMFGFGWTPRVPFATGRKAMMVNGAAHIEVLPDALAANRDTEFAAAVVLGREFDEVAEASAREVGLDPARRMYFWRNGYLLLPPGVATTIDSVRGGEPHPLVAQLARRVPPDSSLPDGLVFWRLPFSHGEGDWVEVIAKRGSSAFFFRSAGLKLVRVRGYFE